MIGRRRFLGYSIVGAAATRAWRAGAAELAGRPAAPKGRLDVALLFDVEDIFSPPAVGNDDSIKELATILTAEKVRGTFLYIGDRAALLRERGRKDVIGSMGPHDVGLHTRSARHPAGPEYVAKKTWDEGVREAMKREKEGVEIIRDVFQKPCAAMSTHAAFATPHAQRVAGMLGLPYVYSYAAAPPLYNASWYAGALGLPYASPTLNNKPLLGYFEGFDDVYPSNDGFSAMLRKLGDHIDACIADGQPTLTLFAYHPQLLRLVEWIDRFWSPNGVNYPKEAWGKYGRPAQRPPADVKAALVNFRRLATWLRDDSRINLMTVSELSRKYGSQPPVLSQADLVQAAQAIGKSKEILVDTKFSPAETVVAMARALVAHKSTGNLPLSVVRDNVLGPTQGPIWHPEMLGCDAGRLVELARELIDAVKTTGHLPATLGAAGARVGVNHLYKALPEAVLAIAGGAARKEIVFNKIRPVPEIATLIGYRYLRSIDNDLMDPQTDGYTSYRDGRLQTWTLKPASASG